VVITGSGVAVADKFFKGVKVPTHNEVGIVIRPVCAGLADFIEDCGKQDPDRHCWGDLLMMAQIEYSRKEVVLALKAMKLKGWSCFIAHTWAPATQELVTAFQSARKGEVECKTWFAKAIRRGTLYGAVGLARTVWKTERNKWKFAVEIDKCSDEEFVEKIIEWFEKTEVIHASNNG